MKNDSCPVINVKYYELTFVHPFDIRIKMLFETEFYRLL
jgi:hypothetical protein